MTWFSRFWSFVLLMSFVATFAIKVQAADPAIQLASLNDSASQPVAPNSELAYAPQWPAPPDTGAMLLRLIIGTAIVLGLCVGSLWLGKPWLMRLQSINTNGQAMLVEGSVSLGNRAVLYLVKVGDTQLIAGTDATGLKSLLALPPSFKEVLDAQMPPAEIVSATQTPQLSVPTNLATRSKD